MRNGQDHMKNLAEKNLCTGCGACEAACPQNAITLKPDKEGFLYPTIDESLCNQCALCTKTCPVLNHTPANSGNACFGAHAKEDDIRLLGSSGGIFPLLALHVLQDGGAVFGAALSQDGSVTHMGINHPDQLTKITKTKYVQSTLSGVWENMRDLLEKGRTVLFCGTPCQSEGLRSYLKKEYDNLLLLDLICYGVTSPGIWQSYIQFLENRYGQKLHNFFFRDKCRQDNGHSVKIQFKDKELSYSIYKDPYLHSYFRNINIRPSCYQCRHCQISRNSDMTLGDFWGIERVNPAFDDGMGNSLLICHTSKGRLLFDRIKMDTEWFPCTEADALQPRLKEPTKRPLLRQVYMGLYHWLPFSLWIRLFK